MEKFTKIYKTERELLRKCNNVAAYEIYMHLKDDSAYYKDEFYDLARCISEYLDISPSTIKRALKALKEVGLIKISKRGKVNVYKLPYAQEKVEKQDKKEQESVKTELFKVAAVKEKVNENIGDFRPEIPQDDTRVQQDIESVPKGQEIGKNGVFNASSDVKEKVMAVISDSSLKINEKYKGIAVILEPYFIKANVPSHKRHRIVDFVYKKYSEAA